MANQVFSRAGSGRLARCAVGAAGWKMAMRKALKALVLHDKGCFRGIRGTELQGREYGNTNVRYVGIRLAQVMEPVGAFISLAREAVIGPSFRTGSLRPIEDSLPSAGPPRRLRRRGGPAEGTGGRYAGLRPGMNAGPTTPLRGKGA